MELGDRGEKKQNKQKMSVFVLDLRLAQVRPSEIIPFTNNNVEQILTQPVAGCSALMVEFSPRPRKSGQNCSRSQILASVAE